MKIHPPESYHHDILIVGAGIIGLTLALELLKRKPGISIGIIEKESTLGRHASGRNSGVVHSGIYYAPQTLKAKLCTRGATLMRAFVEEHGLPIQKQGKVIIATSDEDQKRVQDLLSNAQHNGVRAEALKGADIEKYEPYANGTYGGIYVPDTAVVDSHTILKKLYELLNQQGCRFYFDQKVEEIDLPKKIAITRQAQFHFNFLINSAGAYADELARKFNRAKDYLLLPFKGIYFKLKTQQSHLVRSNIYPVPDLRYPFLGVHFTRVVSDAVYVGPTAIPAFGRENYGIFTGLKLGESLTIMKELVNQLIQDNENFRALAAMEFKKYMKSNFVKAAQWLVPSLKPDDLEPSDKVGIRPQLMDVKSKKLVMDYVIEWTEESLHILNSISPAFTCSMAFASFLVDELEKKPVIPSPR